MLSSSTRLFARVATRPVTQTLLRRGYADAASSSDSNMLELSLVAPHAPVFLKRNVNLVTVPGAAGYMGIARNHVPIIAELKPGVVTVDEPGKPQEKFFVSGGFVYVHQDKTCEVSVLEAFPLDQLDQEAVKRGLTQYNQEFSNATDAESKAKAQVFIIFVILNIIQNHILQFSFYFFIFYWWAHHVFNSINLFITL